MMSEEVEPKPFKSTPVKRRFDIHGAGLLVVFLLGFVPVWHKDRHCAGSLAEADHQLSLVRMQNTLASAVIDARRGVYEPARQAASQFLTSIRAEIDKGDASGFTPAQRQGLQPLLAGRDEVITLRAGFGRPAVGFVCGLS